MADRERTIPEGGFWRRWNFRYFVTRGVIITLNLCLCVFGLYLLGSLPELGFSDSVLFLLLRLLRYVSLSLCAFSLGALGWAVRQLVEHPRLRGVVGLGCYFFTGMLGAALSMLNSFIIAASGGNG